ncbi:MAG: hypothetical protein ACFHXK_18865 [bacterium]
MVPDDWVAYTLGELFDFKNGLNTDASNYGRGTKFVNVMDIFAGPSITQLGIRGSVEVSDAQLDVYGLKRGDVLSIELLKHLMRLRLLPSTLTICQPCLEDL